MRSLPAYLFMFAAGIFCAGTWFYRLHPEHSPNADVPRMRKNVEDAMDRARRVKEAWNRCGGETPIAGSDRHEAIEDTDTKDADLQR